MITRTKNQIRSRSLRVRFDNAEILAASADSANRVLLSDPSPSNVIIDAFVLKTHIVTPYGVSAPRTALDVFFVLSFGRDAGFSQTIEDKGPVACITDLFATAGSNILQIGTQNQVNTDAFSGAGDFVGVEDAGFYPQGDLVCKFSNGGAYTGGNAANWLEIDIYYYLLNQSA